MSRKTKAQQLNEKKIKSGIATILFIFLMMVAVFHAGFLGILLANLLRFFAGRTYFFLGILLSCLAIKHFHKLNTRTKVKKPAHSANKINLWGVFPFYSGILLFLQIKMFADLDVTKPHIIKTTLSLWWQDFTQMKLNNFLGGGFLGSVFYTLTNFLVSKLGSIVLAFLLIIGGTLLLLPIDLATIRELGQKISGFFRERELIQKEKEFNREKNAKSKAPAPLKSLNDKKTTSKENIAQESAPQQMPVITSFQDSTEQKNIASSPDDDENLEIEIKDEVENLAYKLPKISLLAEIPKTDQTQEHKKAQENVIKLEKVFASFGIAIKVTGVSIGPAVTKYEIKPPIGVKVSKITGLADDISLALAAKDIRIEAPIPGKSAIGIELPNNQVSMVSFRDVSENVPKNPNHLLEVPLGRDISGQIQVMDLEKMPHLLIAGSTGSGKSVAVNGIISSILMKAKPNEVKLMMVDPKMVELSIYNGIPHLLTPVVTNPRKAAVALNKVVEEMERRYELFAKFNVRKINSYNEMVRRENLANGENHPTMPLIVVIVDELADLMMVASNDVENAIIRLGQKARAAGIHIILATQRPSVDVVSGLIKANVPSRIAFAVSSGTDSRTILDENGAQKLLGRGDMLYKPLDASHSIRVQGAFISDKDVANLVNFVKNQQEPQYNEKFKPGEGDEKQVDKANHDEYFAEAKKLVIEEQTASVSLIQRRFKTGYNRALRIIEELEAAGIIGPTVGTKPREVLIKPVKESVEEG